MRTAGSVEAFSVTSRAVQSGGKLKKMMGQKQILIVEDEVAALAEEQFTVYLQPKHSLRMELDAVRRG